MDRRIGKSCRPSHGMSMEGCPVTTSKSERRRGASIDLPALSQIKKSNYYLDLALTWK
jgi:hypothetical protein